MYLTLINHCAKHLQQLGWFLQGRLHAGSTGLQILELLIVHVCEESGIGCGFFVGTMRKPQGDVSQKGRYF